MIFRLILTMILSSLTALMVFFPPSLQPYLEEVYGGTLYPGIQSILRKLPLVEWFAIADILWLTLIVVIITHLIYILVKRGLRGIGLMLTTLTLWLSLLSFLVMFMWGLNYHRPSLLQRLEQPSFATQLEPRHWNFALEHTHAAFMALAPDINTCAYSAARQPVLKPASHVHSAMTLAGLPSSVVQTVRPSAWSFYYRGVGIAGLYVPFTGEPTYNRFLFPLAQPFTMAHEYAHWTGLAREYDADIIAYWSLWFSPDPYWRLSAWIEWWRSISAPAEILAQLDARIVDTLKCYQSFQQQQGRWQIRHWHWRLYEKNLQALGVSEGLKSYQSGEAIALIHFQDWLKPKQER